ncbi:MULTISPECIES: CAP domain-containing protein [unclassified Moorena]|uniref:CAP domain-containing protein n=1 Tax=unclassified Moorena TaxID=2683338 RepID=UPI0013B88A65|nr:MULTISPECIES: CAP domain-containing protein [unclassified Moorena]NEQ14974.1 CAP domain-containing protein [Moorena sp. SIO3E2]NEP31310.1 CAP domain-containing protein [Moorena sp. SIO3B2]NER87390.1 CAP domain-containing protein [Moorena sp. SIO3A2]NES45623.1 CAP domain-containing protein [Moorena sp. SIO2C4]NET65880.1 CAP domain-containing protein [Moorena sp. SIO1G6]
MHKIHFWAIAPLSLLGLFEIALQSSSVLANPYSNNTLQRGSQEQITVLTSSSSLAKFNTELLGLTNAERRKAGLPPLQLSAELTQAAQLHAEDMVRNGFFSHTGSDGSKISDRAKAAGYLYSYVGENIAAGYPTPAQTIRQWMKSSGHRRNILKPQYQEIGFGYVSDPSSPYRHYWVQVFGSPR